MTYEFSDEIRAFLQEKRYLQNVSSQTIVLYETSFKAFYQCENLEDVKKRIVVLRDKGIKPVSVNTYLRHMKTFYLSLGREWKLPWLKEEQKILATLTSEQIVRILGCPFSKAVPERNLRRAHLVALTILDTGLRASEVLGLTKEDVDFENLIMKVLGKGGKHRLVPFSIELRKALWRHCHIRQSHSNKIFGTKNNTAVSVRNLERDFKVLGKKLGISGIRFSPHTFRHSFACQYLKNGGDLFALSQILGHSQLETTKIYLSSLGIEHLSANHRQFSPLSQRR